MMFTVAEVESALQLTRDQYKNKYGRDKPECDTRIIFSCRSGKRSDMAMQIALKLGFEK